MRATFSGLNTMVRGIFSNQLSLDTVGHNITNASTEGYSRQSVQLGATPAEEVAGMYGGNLVGTGVTDLSITRARDFYADRQYWQEEATQNYFKTRAKNYDKVESVFDDSEKHGIKNAMEEFYKSWDALSTTASLDSSRVTVAEKGRVYADRIKTAAAQLQDQIRSQYEDMRLSVTQINEYTTQIVALNKSILAAEATGAMANDLRDQRDLTVDKLSEYVNLSVEENSNGMYSLVSNGISFVNGASKLDFKMSDPVQNKRYGVNDYSVEVADAKVTYIPANGSLRAQMDGIRENKQYMDELADMAGYMMTTFNQMHQQGAGIDGSDSALGTAGGPTYGINFWGDDDSYYTWDADRREVVRTSYRAGTVTRTLDVVNITPASGTTNPHEPRVTITGTVDPSKSKRLAGIEVINELALNAKIAEKGGTSRIAARKFSVDEDVDPSGARLGTYTTRVNGTGDGTNAVSVKNAFNMDRDNVKKAMNAAITADVATIHPVTGVVGAASPSNIIAMSGSPSGARVVTDPDRSIADVSLNSFYLSMMTKLGSDSQTMDGKADAQGKLVEQIVSWRNSTSSVDWNEELSNMIKFQKGYSACSRCLTTMDEMLDRLINSTGMVGR
ncbi:MAG: flagellar hook-associated protein FlgK [Mitsuokella sp.]